MPPAGWRLRAIDAGTWLVVFPPEGVPIPPFDQESGLLPPGEHEAGWEEIQARLGWNARR